MAKKMQRGLGRGLGALLGDTPEEAPSVNEATAPEASVKPEPDTKAVQTLPIGIIDPNPDQPRRSFDETALQELAQSIRSVGILQPIIVCPNKERFTIIAGERRYRAARIADLAEVPVIIRDWDENLRLEAALIENLQRDDLNPVDEAMGIRRLMDEVGLTQEKVSERLGKSRPAVANQLRLLTLPDEVLAMLKDGRLSSGHARALVPLDKDKQIKYANMTVQIGLSVRQLERICAQGLKDKKQDKPPKDIQVAQLETMVRDLFGTRVKLDGTQERGKITLYYYNAEDLQHIWDIVEAAKGE